MDLVGRGLQDWMFLLKRLYFKSAYSLSILSQFSISKVRMDFQQGRFEFPKLYKLSIAELDQFRDIILPSFGNGSSIKKGVVLAQSALFDLTSQNKDTMKLNGPNSYKNRTYLEWNNIIMDLAMDDYWNDAMANGDVSDLAVSPIQYSSTPFGVSDAQTNTVPKETQNVATNTVESPVECCTTLNASTAVNTISIPSVQDNASNENMAISSVVKEKCLPHRNSFICGHCFRRGHSADNCWRRKKLCLICGDKHKMVDCSRYFDRVLNLNKPKCTICLGAHLGMNCRQRIKLDRYCNWCGRSSHTEGECWRKSGACLACGDHNHKIRDCVKRNLLPPLLFPPWCVECGCQHLGTDCDSPFIE